MIGMMMMMMRKEKRKEKNTKTNERNKKKSERTVDFRERKADEDPIKLPNEEVNVYKRYLTTDMVKSKGIIFTVHEIIEKVCRIIVEKHERNKIFGRFSPYIIQLIWIYLSQDTYQSPAFLYTTTNVQIL